MALLFLLPHQELEFNLGDLLLDEMKGSGKAMRYVTQPSDLYEAYRYRSDDCLESDAELNEV